MNRKDRILRKQFKQLLRPLVRAVLDKLIRNEHKYRWNNAWRGDWVTTLRLGIRQHVEKGDPIDVIIYAFFAWVRGWSLAWPAPPQFPTDLVQVATVSFSSQGPFTFELSLFAKSGQSLYLFLVDNGVLSIDDQDSRIYDLVLDTWPRAKLDALPEYDG